MSSVIHRSLSNSLPTLSHGEGLFVYDNQNNSYLDASGGAAVCCLGHNHPAPIEAIHRQISQLPYIHSGFFTSDVTEELAEELAALAPGDIRHTLFLSGGSEAVESALKLARQYYFEKGQTKRNHFISRRQSYHGNTLGVLAVGHHESRKEPYRPLLIDSHAISPCYPYREQRADESEQEYGRRIADELEAKILELRPESVIGFVAETVGGATAGVQPPVDGYLKRIRQICDRYGILLILDEVMCGSGRTGTFFSCEQDGVIPDIVILAKGLGAGYQPIAATMCSSEIYDTLQQGSGSLANGFTYMGHATACAASLAVIRTIEEDNLLENVTRQGKLLVNLLNERLGSHPNVGDIRGRGLFVGVEFVAKSQTREPFDPRLQFHSVLKQACHKNGLLVYPGGGTIDGKNGDHVLLAPPYIVDEAHIEMIVDRLYQSIEDGLKTIKSSTVAA
ncbi:MAG: aspartate aminotransferase family protein [Acidiferrobacterales bacterium]|nr:aspartate aminotransferase family protein [Acidiferrobacterales bacterium]